MLLKTGDLKNSAQFTRKHLFWNLLLIKLLWFFKENPSKVFPVNTANFLRIAFVTEHWWLLLT